MKRRAKNNEDKKKAKFEDSESIPTIELDRCYVDIHLINYYNPKSLICHDFKKTNNPVVFLRSYTSVYSSETPCMYDHHEFTGKSFCVPKKWCPESGFTVWGKFCSLECCRAYIDNPSNSQRDREMTYLATMGRKLYGRTTEIKKAPSILLLKRYGGPLTIDEFREEFSSNRQWIVQSIKTCQTHLTYDVYFNNDTFELHNAGGNKECRFRLKRDKLPAHQTKKSLLTMFGRKEVDD